MPRRQTPRTHRITKIATTLLAVAIAMVGVVATAGPASAASLRLGAVTNADGPGVLYVDDGGYCEPGVDYAPNQPVGTVSTCRSNPAVVRIEVYPIPLAGRWDPFATSTGGLALEAPNGGNVGDLTLPSASTGGLRLTGKIASTTAIENDRLHVNIFQLLNTTPNGVGAFGSFFANRGDT